MSGTIARRRPELQLDRARFQPMAKGLKTSDWTVSQRGNEGTIRSAEYRGRFKVRRAGLVQIIWQDGPEPGECGPVERAAQEAIAAAIWPRE